MSDENEDTGNEKSTLEYLEDLVGEGDSDTQERKGGEEQGSATAQGTEQQSDDDDRSPDGGKGGGAEDDPGSDGEQSGSEGDESKKGDGATSSDDPKDDDGSDQKAKAKTTTRPVTSHGSKIDWNKRKNEIAKEIFQEALKVEGVEQEIDNSPAAKAALFNSVQARADQKVFQERTEYERVHGQIGNSLDRMASEFGNDWLETWKSQEFFDYVMGRPKYIQDTIRKNNQVFVDFQSVAQIFRGFQAYSNAGEQKGQEQGQSEKSGEQKARKRKDRNPPGPLSRSAKNKGLEEPGANASVTEHLQYLMDTASDDEQDDNATYL